MSSKTCYLDTNILVYFADRDSPRHQLAINTLSELGDNEFRLYISPLVLDEFIHAIVMIHRQNARKRIRSSQLQAFLKQILALPKLEIVNPPTAERFHLQVPDLMEKFKLGARDAYHLQTIKTNRIKYLATFDSDFNPVFQRTSLKAANLT